MAETYTPIDRAPPATFTLPVNTELADAEAFKTNVLKPLADADHFLASILALPGLLGRRPQIDALVAGSVVVGPFTAYFPAAGKYAAQTSPLTLTNANIDVSPGSWANSTTYYLYADWAAGALRVQLSQVGPDAALRNQSGGATDKLYLGCVMTNSSGVLIPWRGANGRYAFSVLCQVVTAGTGATWTVVDLASCIPQHAVLVSLQAQITNSSIGVRTLYIRPRGGTDQAIELTSQAGQTGTTGGEMPLGTANDIEYGLTLNNTVADIWITGFSEP